MEETQTDDLLDKSMFDVAISPSIAHSARESARLARLLVYISSGAIGLTALLCFFNWNSLSREFYSVDETVTTIILIVWSFFAGVYITFLVLLFIFADKILKGLNENNIQKIEQAFSSLKLYFIIATFFDLLLVASFIYQIIKALMK